MEQFPSNQQRPPEYTPRELARNCLISSLFCSVLGGITIGNTISMIDVGYDPEDMMLPIALEGAFIIASVAFFDKFLQARQEIRRNR